MPYDSAVRMRSGEVLPLYAELASADGWLDLSGATVTLYDDVGAAVVGHSAVPATGFDQEAATTPRAWYVLNTAGLVGFYRLVFTLSGTGSDGIARLMMSEILVLVEAVP